MAVSDFGAGSGSSRVQLRYIEETAWGATPTTPTFANFRATGETMTLNKGSAISNEIRSDRQIPDLIATSYDASGGFNFELSQDTYDDFFAGALFGNWSTTVGISAVTIAATATGFTDSANGFGSIGVGQWIKVKGFANSNNNTYYKVTAVSAGVLTTSPAPVAVEAVGNIIIIDGSMLRNGTTAHSFSIEREHADVTQFFLFTGMMVGDMSLSFSSGGVISGTFGFNGKDVARAAATSSTGGSPTPATTTPITNAVSNLGSFLEAGATPSASISGLDLQLTNGLQGQRAVGSQGLVGVGLGRAAITGSLTVYFKDGTLYDKYRTGTSTSLSWKVEDANGEAYILSLPNVRLSNASINASSPDQEILAQFNYQAIRDSVTDATIQLDRFTA